MSTGWPSSLSREAESSAAGPAPNYDMQKILATRSPREAALMSGFVSVMLPLGDGIEYSVKL